MPDSARKARHSPLMASPPNRGSIAAANIKAAGARALAEKNELPPGRDPAHQRVRSAAVVLPADQPYKEAARDALRAEPGKPHVSV